MAVSGFKGFGWILGLATVSPACYMVSSMVAAERGRVEAVERAIVAAHRDIRRLETEFETRANIAQLERWNGEVLALGAPRPDQYLPGAAALASFRPGASARGGEMAMVMPAALPDAVEDDAAVAAPAAAPAPTKAVVAVSAPAPVLESPAVAESAGRAAKATTRKVQKVAMLDDQLLSDSTLGDIVRKANREAGKLR